MLPIHDRMRLGELPNPYIIKEKDVGVYIDGDFGKVIKPDVGKMIILRNGIIQMENTKQMSMRGKGWHGEHRRHKDVATRTQTKKAKNTPMAKSDSGLKYIIEAKRWFERTNGNTYHTVVVIDAQTRDEVFHSGFTYGYGDQWRYTALMGLINKGLFDKKDLYNHELIRRMFYMRVEDVTRKKDLDL